MIITSYNLLLYNIDTNSLFYADLYRPIVDWLINW